MDIAMTIMAMACASDRVSVSAAEEVLADVPWLTNIPRTQVEVENAGGCEARIRNTGPTRMRVLGHLSDGLRRRALAEGCYCDEASVLTNGRFELLRYLLEQSLSVDYHRYGNLGVREPIAASGHTVSKT